MGKLRGVDMTREREVKEFREYIRRYNLRELRGMQPQKF